MKRKPNLDMDKIAKALGGERRGKVRAGSGHFGAMQLVAEVQARFQTPTGGGRGTDPSWTEKRLLPLTPDTLDRLEHLAAEISKQGVNVSPLQIAALLLEHAIEDVDDKTAAELARKAAS
jgi:hypothetical protein